MSEQQPTPGQPADGIRASDADRERLISELNEHTVEGRLTTEEFEHRLQSVYSARTTGELGALRRDLPETGAQLALSHAARRSHLTRRLIQETGGSAALFVVCTAIWLASGHDGHHGQFWPVWILVLVVLSLARNGWALFGPAPDLDAVEQHLDTRRRRRLDRDQRRRGRRRLGP
jgi:hypothetical protein